MQPCAAGKDAPSRPAVMDPSSRGARVTPYPNPNPTLNPRPTQHHGRDPSDADPSDRAAEGNDPGSRVRVKTMQEVLHNRVKNFWTAWSIEAKVREGLLGRRGVDWDYYCYKITRMPGSLV